MSAVSSTVQAASSADLGSVQGAAAVSVMKKAMNAQAASTMELLASVAQPAPALATSGNAGLLLHAVA
jgi:hypothetical protein